MHTTPDIMNAILSRFVEPRYLEIGVFNGETFFNVQATQKVAVDPDFKFNAAMRHAEYAHENFYQVTSDEFFQSIASENENNVWDVVYIDGFHSYEQAWKDFLNVLPYTHENSIIVFDDTVPCDPYSALPNPDLTMAFKSRARLYHNSWHGDVYKCLFHLHDYAKNFSYGTIVDSDNPRTVVWRSEVSARTSVTMQPDQIARLSYFDLFQYGYIICPMQLEVCLEYIGKSINPQEHFSTEQIMDLFINPLISV